MNSKLSEVQFVLKVIGTLLGTVELPSYVAPVEDTVDLGLNVSSCENTSSIIISQIIFRESLNDCRVSYTIFFLISGTSATPSPTNDCFSIY